MIRACTGNPIIHSNHKSESQGNRQVPTLQEISTKTYSRDGI